jgi:hypothetical protein
MKSVRPEWVAGDENALDALFEKLMRPRGRVTDDLLDCVTEHATVVPNSNYLRSAKPGLNGYPIERSPRP